MVGTIAGILSYYKPGFSIVKKPGWTFRRPNLVCEVKMQLKTRKFTLLKTKNFCNRKQIISD